jgi:UDP-N-acetylmuramate--alanine ligase
MYKKIKKIHFIGIGGSGMSGIAEIMFNMNYQISGSDTGSSETLDHLRSRGIKIFNDHKEVNVKNVDVVVTSSAISKKNQEVIYAAKNKIPIIPRAEMLAELMRYKYGIAIAGTHGKTSTTSMLAEIMNKGGMDPTYVIGGRINSLKQNAKLGKSKIMIVEADESDASFLHLNPAQVLITNIDKDHMENYGGSMENLKETFLNFIHQIPFYNEVFICLDDKVNKSILKKISRPIVTFGITNKADYYASEIKFKGNVSEFNFNSKLDKKKRFKVKMKMPGKHYVSNCVGAIAIALKHDVSVKNIQIALSEFNGVSRRFDLYEKFKLTEKKVVDLIDDYGHHPTEIKAVLDSIKKGYPKKKINLVFQPHRYSRTHELFHDFVKVLSLADRVFLFEIYPAGEKNVHAVSAKKIMKNLSNKKYFLNNFESARKVIEDNVENNSILLVMGAGSIGSWFKKEFNA